MTILIYNNSQKYLHKINIILIHVGHHSRPVSGINAELPVEEKYEYIAPLPHVHVHMSRDIVNQPERPDGSSIPLSANESYSATTRF